MATSNTKVGSDKIRIRLKAYDYVVSNRKRNRNNYPFSTQAQRFKRTI